MNREPNNETIDKLMKLYSKLSELGLSETTLDDLCEDEPDITRLIVRDEFMSSKPGNYRENAVRRLAENKYQFYNECNIGSVVVSRYIRVICPYCGLEMKNKGSGGGNSHSYSYIFKCACGAESTLSLENNRGLSFAPSDSK